MIKERVADFLSIKYEKRLLIFDTGGFSNAFNYAELLEYEGFCVVHYIDVEAFRLRYELEIKNSTKKLAVIIRDDIYMIIVQNYIGNSKSPNTIVVPVTHDIGNLPCLVPLTPIVDQSTGKTILDGQANTANIVCVSKARLGDLIATLSNADMKKIDESMAQTLELMHYLKDLKEKYDKLSDYNEKVKIERNAAQDKINSIKELISKDGFTEQSQKSLLELLDK